MVSAVPKERELLGRWLEAEGLEVMACPGPGEGACIGLAEGWCPLAADADVVVLQASGPRPGAPHIPWLDLIDVYAVLGRPVVALLAIGHDALVAAGARTLALPREPSREALLDAVERVLSAAS